VGNESVELDEAALIQQHVQSLARRELPLVVLRFDTLSASALLRLGASPFEQVELITHCHRGEKVTQLSAIG
jgi:hypothetical protein